MSETVNGLKILDSFITMTRKRSPSIRCIDGISKEMEYPPKHKFSIDLDYGYSTSFNHGHVFQFDMEILKLELVNNTDPDTTFRLFIGTMPSYESQPVTSITPKEIKEGFDALCPSGAAWVGDGGLCPGRSMVPVLTLDGQAGEDTRHDVHMRVTFLMKKEHYTLEEATKLIQELLERDRSPFVRSAVHYVNWGTPEESKVFLKGSSKPPATQGQFY